MSERTQWVFSRACGCPMGVLEGRYAPTRSRAWKEFFETAPERDRAMDAGVTVALMGHGEYVSDVMPKLRLDYQCPHGGAS